jgi:glycosyltransferase involved in cell wall biosynthesis
MRTRAFLEIERRLARQTTRLIAVAPGVRDDLVQLGVAPPEKFTVIRLGIDLEARIHGDRRAEYRRRFSVPEDRFVVGWVGRMTAVKRLEDVLKGFRELLNTHSDAYLCLVGDGPDRNRMERLAHELGIMRRCLFVGYQDDVGRFYELFDVLVLPSANEGTPVSVIESLAAGRPVVATGVGGVPDVVEDGVDGFLVDAGDVGAIGARLSELAGDVDLRRTMADAGQSRMRDRYAVERLVDDVDRLYRALLASTRPPATPENQKL